MAIPASTPLHLYWCIIRAGSILILIIFSGQFQPFYLPSGLLVGVGHHATDEVGLGLVEDAHQVVELALEVGRHSLAALALLTLLVLGSLS